MATTVVRGLAIINAIVGGVPTNITAWANTSPQSVSVTHNWETENVKDASGFTASRQGRDEKFEKKFSFKPTAQTLALARSATVFLAPFAKFTFAGSDAPDFDGDWQLESGDEIQIKNDATADYSASCTRWADNTQNNLLNTVPS